MNKLPFMVEKVIFYYMIIIIIKNLIYDSNIISNDDDSDFKQNEKSYTFFSLSKLNFIIILIIVTLSIQTISKKETQSII